jgi:hypothetical protein
MSVSSCIFNLQTRLEDFEGKKHLVVPVVMLVEGVHKNSAGAMFYPASEIMQFPKSWDGVPVPILHPIDEQGMPLSANNPEIIEKQSVGRVWNTFWDGEKLRAEVWIDVEKTKKIAPEVLAAIQNDRQLEISTSHWGENELKTGEWNGEEYDMIARAIRPDHLALLPGQTGACSWDDGCGIRANADNRTYTSWRNMIQRCYDKNSSNYKYYGTKGITVVKKWKDSYDAFLKDMGKRPAKTTLHRKNNKKGYSAGNCEWNKKEGRDLKKNEEGGEDLDENKYLSPFFNELSHGDIRQQLRSLLPVGNENLYYFIRDVFDGYFVYVKEEQEKATLFKQAYSKDASDKVDLSGDPVEVFEKTEYVTTNLKKGEIVMEKCCPERVAALIANETSVFTDEHKEWLESLPEEQLVLLEVKEPEKVDHFAQIDWSALSEDQVQLISDKLKLTANEPGGDKPQTVEEYISNAPEEMQNVLRDGHRMHKSKKTEIVKGLLANKRNTFTEDQLNSKDIVELEALSVLAQSAPADFTMNSPDASVSQGDDEPLIMPSLDFSKK